MKSFIPLIRSEWRLLLFGFAMTFASSLGQTYFISLFGGEIRADLDLSHAEFGGVYSLATLASAALLLWSGSFIDRVDLRRFSYITVVGLALGCLSLASSYHIISLCLGILLLRHLGQGLMYMTSTTAMVRYLDQQKGKASALSGIGYSISEAVLPSIVIAMLLWLSWRETWVVWAGILLLSMPLLIYYLLRDHDQRHQRYLRELEEEDNATDSGKRVYKRRQWTRSEVLRDPLFYLFMPALMAEPLLFTGFMFHQVHLVEEKGWSLAFWGGLYVLYAVVSAVVKLFAGVLVDRFGAIKLVPLMSLPFALGFFALASSSSTTVAVAFMFALGVSVGLYSTIFAPFFSEKYGNKHLGSIKSLASSTMVFFSALSPVILGWLIDAGVSINQMAFCSGVYILLVSALAVYACWLLNSGRDFAPGV